MSDRTAASIGLVLAGVALANAFVPWAESPSVTYGIVAGVWSPVGAILAAVALVAFALRRWGRIDRESGAAVAGVASVALVVYAAVVLVRAVAAEVEPAVGLPTAVVLGIGGLAAAYLDRQNVDRSQILQKTVTGAGGLFIGTVGFLVSIFFGALPFLVFGQLPPTTSIVVLTTFFGLGLGVAAIAFIMFTSRGFDYIDFKFPDQRDVVYMVVGTVAIFGALIVLGVLVNYLDLPSAESDIVSQGRENPETLLLLVPLSFLVIGPGEELLFRNIVQKYLYESFSTWGAIIVGCFIFTLMHVPAYFTTDPIALTTTLTRLFFLSLILGYSYAATENITVPTIIHGAFNAVQFALLYVHMTVNMDEIAFLAGALAGLT